MDHMESDNILHRVFEMRGEIEDAFSELIHSPWGEMEEKRWHPSIDIFETENEYIIIADLPGIVPEEVTIEVSNHTATLCGNRAAIAMKKTGRHIVLERTSGRFCRTFHLPCSVAIENAETEYRNGIYLATLPKKQKGTMSKKCREENARQ